MEEIIRKVKWKDKGLQINGTKLSNLRFADDIVLISESMEELVGMIKELNEEGKKAGLSINIGKSKIITTTPNAPKIKVDKKELEIVSETINPSDKQFH